jgi:hypothetical protein
MKREELSKTNLPRQALPRRQWGKKWSIHQMVFFYI